MQDLSVLVAPGFDARLLVKATTLGRQAGQSVTLVGLIAGPIRSEYGIMILPDQTLEQFIPGQVSYILIPGGQACAEALLRDPRVHRVCEAVRKEGGAVFAAPEVSHLVKRAGLQLDAPQDVGEPVWLHFIWEAKK